MSDAKAPRAWPKAELWLAAALCLLWALLVRAGPLDLAYFWDEADVYVPGAKWLADNGLDLRPGVFPDDYSRGHPPLMYALAGAAFRLFGPEPLVGHLLVLPFAALGLLATYLLGRAAWGRAAGLAAALLLGLTPLYASISAMLLPEVALTALTALSFLFFVRGRFWALALTGSALVLIKETGLFTPLALAGALGLQAIWRRKLFTWHLWKRVGLILVPVPMLALFFLWQKLGAGYFIFPHHQNLFWQRDLAVENLLTVFPSTLLWHGRWIPLAAAAVMAFYLRFKAPAEVPGESTDEAPPLILAVFLLLLGNAIFFTQMFWLHRYALPCHPGILVIACGVLLDPRLSRAGRTGLAWLGLRALPILAAGVWAIFGLRAPTPPDEAELNFSYADVVATHQQALRAIETLSLAPNDRVLTAWPMTVELEHPYLGYVDHPIRSKHIDNLPAGAAMDDYHFKAVLAPTRSRHTQGLRELAERLQFSQNAQYQVGLAQALELWTP